MMNMGDVDSEILASFLDEAGQCVTTLNEKLLLVESGDAEREVIDEMFRAAHSMKGSAGFLNLTEVTRLTHSLETVLDWVRKEKLEFRPDVVDSLFQAIDIISALLADIASGTIGDLDISPFVSALEALLDSEPQQDQSGDPEFELGPLPDWLQDRLEFDDVLDALVAKNSGLSVYGILISLRDVFQRECNVLELYHAIESAVTIQNVIPLPEAADSPWRPLGTYDFRVGVFCFTDREIRDALSGIDMPPCEAWLIDKADNPAEPIHLGIELTDIGEHVSCLRIKSDMEKHKATWLSETRDELDQLDMSLLACEQEPMGRESLNELFRLMHRIKGSSGSMGLDEMARVAHNAESLLSQCRDSGQSPNEDGFRALFMTKDFLNECLCRVQTGSTRTPEAEVLDELIQGVLLSQQEEAAEEWSIPTEHLSLADEASAAGKTVWQVTLRLRAGTPLPDIRYGMILRSLEECTEVLYTIPSAQELDQGIDDISELRVLLASDGEESSLRELLQFDMVDQCLTHQMRINHVAEASAPTPAPTAPTSDPGQLNSPTVLGSDTVRVDTARLDQLMNVAGELVITKARVTQLAETINRQAELFDIQGLGSLLTSIRQLINGKGEARELSFSKDRLRRIEAMVSGLKSAQDCAVELRDTTVELHRHTSSVQNSVMQIRMVPIGPLFKRFHRLIRDLCKERDRDARLITVGESTELDKKLIDELTDPLTHLIRNSVDHGLETPGERVSLGKPEQGTVKLEAFHEGGQICIRVSDDGRGLNTEKIKEKAIANGLISADVAERMPDEEAYGLIFQPGFSTAAKVTNISGRGVGMDIVRSKINELKGKIDIESELGKGTAFTIRLPLTLAMIEALLVQIGNTRYAFPLEAVREIVEVEKNEINSVEAKGNIMFLRDEAISLVELEKIMDVDPVLNGKPTMRAVVTKGAGETLAIAVDRVIGDEEIVVKALSEEFSAVRGISGATVLGDGGIALILDVGAICELSKTSNAYAAVAMEVSTQ